MGMRQYLVKWYPVYPWDELEIVDLDILKPVFCPKTEHLGFKTIKENIQLLKDEYDLAVKRHGLDSHGFTYYNNSRWCLIEAENSVKAVCIFNEKIEEESKDHENKY